jgi:hypothetical protein
MPAIAFAIPRKKGKEETAKQLTQELLGGRGEDLHARRRAHGFKRIRVWEQDSPEMISIIYLEADDLDSALKQMAADEHEHNTWFAGMVEDVTGHHPHQADTRPASRLVIDWHHEKGHSGTHHD